MADTIIDHVKKSKSLFIMCHIPVFCWISATVLQNILEKKSKDQTDDTQESNTDETPRTLTQMYTHFFRFQIQQSRRKYDGEYSPDISWDMDSIYSLGKLAFEQLEKSNLIFYESDLEECGIDVSKASVYSGMCTQIFKQETGIILGTVYCFVHLSIQEFIAALYAHLFLDKNKKNVFVQELMEPEAQNETLTGLLKTAVDKALESDDGHLDLFLRFLLGLSLESNRPLLRGLLSQEESNKQNNTEIVEYIKQKFEDSLCPERSINLFYCLNELNDQTLVQEIQKHLSEGSLSSSDLSPAQWSALAFVLLTSDEELEEFELQKYKKSDECLIRLLPVVKSSKHALLNNCNLTDKSCSSLAEVLSSDNSLEELNMSNNNLQDDGVKRLSEGLKNTNCELNKLSVSECSIGEEGYKCLYSAVRSNPESHLIELDLRGNDPGETGVKLIYQLIQDHKCKLNTVRFLSSSSAVEAFEYLTETLGINPLLQREVNLSHKLDESRVNQICDLLKDKHCRINTLILSNSSITAGGCADLMSAFTSNPSHLTHLDLSKNKLEDSGMMKISDLLRNSQCKLHKLDLSDCSIGEEGYKCLCSAVRSNPESHLIELDLRGNDPGETGVKLIYQLIQDHKYKLNTVRFLSSSSSVEAFEYLTETLGINPLLQREVNLSHKLDESRVNQICDLLKDKHCRINTLILINSSITAGGFADLMSAIKSKPSHLKHLDLTGNKLEDSVMMKISELLENAKSKLQKLNLSECSIGEEGYKCLYSAVRSNPESHLIELDLRGNDPGETGVKLIYQLIQDHKCELNTVRFLKTRAAEEACDHLCKALDVNPLLLKELNLSHNKLGDLDGEKLSALLMDSHSKVTKIILNDCELTENQCSALAAVLSCKTLVKEMNLSNSPLMDSGLKHICDQLKNPQCQLQILK
ncbi:NACHT, LRR and PYD domains-containing protein 3 [Triplophysa tibetana]|uniref:NACHT, LRR and PYD domains-containing protein 3 n=1 Tax=Triplophysa tibetana TaxID=1572043 RepID=A0A5A9NPB0_9TELE|nr:NACHT, LRR and PYD domains-containing protein 3 [Triplophysa tibetana]